MYIATNGNLKQLSLAYWPSRNEPQRFTGSTNGDEFQIPAPCQANERIRMRGVGVDCGYATISDEFEQAQLRRQVVREIRVIIHVIAADIREPGRCDPHTIDPVLIETMT